MKLTMKALDEAIQDLRNEIERLSNDTGKDVLRLNDLVQKVRNSADVNASTIEIVKNAVIDNKVFSCPVCRISKTLTPGQDNWGVLYVEVEEEKTCLDRGKNAFQYVACKAPWKRFTVCGTCLADDDTLVLFKKLRNVEE